MVATPDHSDANLSKIVGPNDTIGAGLFRVMGSTGTGNSSFIRRSTGDESIEIGHGIEPLTSEIGQYNYFNAGGRCVTLPGFDDSCEGATDTDVLRKITALLEFKAGSELATEMRKLLDKHSIERANLKKEMEEAIAAKDEALKKELDAERTKMQNQRTKWEEQRGALADGLAAVREEQRRALADGLAAVREEQGRALADGLAAVREEQGRALADGLAAVREEQGRALADGLAAVREEQGRALADGLAAVREEQGRALADGLAAVREEQGRASADGLAAVREEQRTALAEGLAEVVRNLSETPPRGIWVRSGGILDFIRTLYQNILDRDPENSEALESHTLNTYTHGLASTVDNFFMSPEYESRGLSTEATVDKYYLSLLGRQPEAQGKAYWVGEIQRGMTLRTVANGFVGSDEYHGRVRAETAPDPVHWP
ncbi:hypothetical protein K443DRAFT_122535 [Laccaria amethystina LaAM-08-1]|uniref:DUF4214 domain-containing protein n=1 Tax=Laccaria amethystina LaAM-08-1 TaxID=1095629 RepID=A0A0C9XTS4_9AGAR|nr:hypothetical protein K443DRAFT_122535 [Laccaria amethystina LaAM-08-1]